MRDDGNVLYLSRQSENSVNEPMSATHGLRGLLSPGRKSGVGRHRPTMDCNGACQPCGRLLFDCGRRLPRTIRSLARGKHSPGERFGNAPNQAGLGRAQHDKAPVLGALLVHRRSGAESGDLVLSSNRMLATGRSEVELDHHAVGVFYE